MFDQQGRRYIDFLSGAGVLAYGHNNRRIKQAVLDYLQDDGIVQSLDLHTTAKLAFLRRFRDTILASRGLDYRVQFCGPTGADAVEAALKLARKYTGRQTVLAFTNAYHGVTAGALAATANKRKRAAAGVPLEFVARMPFDGYLGAEVDTIEVLERMLEPGGGIDDPAAIIVETVQAEGGVNVASVAWLQRLAELARRRGVVLIVDDIQVGCGRTGTFFSFERAGIKPDIVCLSKAVGGMGMPIALALIRPELDVWAPGEHVGTFRGNNLAFVGATAALDYWRTPGFESDVVQRGGAMRQQLAAIANRHPLHFSEVRGIGMIWGLVCRGRELASAVVAAAFARGVLVELSGPCGNVIKLLPPLVINEDELKEGLAILAAAADDAVTSACEPIALIAS